MAESSKSSNAENTNVDRVRNLNVSLLDKRENVMEILYGKDGSESAEEPKVGMSFSSEEEVRLYYMKYAKQVGFGVSKRSSKPGDNGKLRYFTLACVQQGTPKSNASNILKPRPVEKMGCKAKINAALTLDGRFTLSTVVLEHTHALSPGKAIFFRCHKRLGSKAKRKLEPNEISGIHTSKNFKSLVETKSSENLPLEEKDYQIDKTRQHQLGVGGSEALRNFFIRMQQKNDHFFYVMDADDECRVRNVFWADARCKAAYESFGDVITFDTTYLTKAYKIPLVSFMGVNHHGQLILFGCGLILSEDTNSFVSLFESWLRFMNCRAPNAIITDQDKTLQNAIARVFPRAQHRFCLWQIIKRLPENFGAHSQYEAIKSSLQSCVYDSLSRDEFEESWQKLLERYNLHDNAWLNLLYGDRHLWVPSYLKNTFLAGMCTIQRGEGMNSFFDDYVNSKTTLKQFFEQFDNVLRRKVENEMTADFNSFSTQIPCITHYSIEKQFQEVYTITKFKEVQDEFRGFLYCVASLPTCEDSIHLYQVTDEIKVDGFIKRAKFCVAFNEDNAEVKCPCNLFEFKGILCRHALRVLTMLDKDLSSKYILDRWRKDLKRKYTFVKSSYDDLSGNLEAQRYDKLTKSFFEVALIASKSEEACMKSISHVSRLKGELVHHGSSCDSSTPSHHLPVASLGISMQAPHHTLDVMDQDGGMSTTNQDVHVNIRTNFRRMREVETPIF
ncbi:hypothetical protein F2P56_020257 [Juglans regia]|uniref:Protein FAR1-RELATED SEQUENCE n=2 Tax=Juglans regia TaxID=51240 RepID=A0A833ULP3_JUGRE|nr:protein FAR-RED IMPAIRED RESPONSE 1-like isoform X2 [Juglans regia]KAF5460383.1 hypothetical protein F2P56_020257 [Juglans regia]